MRGRVVLGTAMLCTAAMIGSGYVHPFGNPRSGVTMAAKNAGKDLRNAKIPADTRAVLVAKCADCHSDETKWPPYARIAPGSWLIERDVIEGRRHMNLSRWSELTADDRQVLESKIIQETRKGDMPPFQYRILHWGAKLSAEDVRALSKLNSEGDPVEGDSGGRGDAERGKAVFTKRCTGCHAMDVNREGPKLRGVFDRRAGQIEGFTYSTALKASGITWDEESLDKWLSDPDAMIPENAMSFRVVKAAERLDLIEYLKRAK
jgi:cytochrome c